MFTTLRLTNIGPHADLTIPVSPTGTTRIAGRSGSGKSTILYALASLLYGDALNSSDGQEGAISATTAKGNTLTRDGSRWTYTKKGTPPQHFRTHDDFAKVVPAEYALRAAVGRFILLPHAHDDLYTKDRGRTLQSILTAALGNFNIPGIVRELAPDVADDDPLYLTGKGGALELQATRNREAAIATGAHQAAEAEHARAVADLARCTIVAPADILAAQRVADAATAWGSYDIAHERWAATDRARQLATSAADLYDAKIRALGDRPASADTMTARVTVENRERDVARIRAEIREAELSAARDQARAEAEARVKGQREAEAMQAGPRGTFDGPFAALAGDKPAGLFARQQQYADVSVKIKGHGDHVVTFESDDATASAVAWDGRRIS